MKAGVWAAVIAATVVGSAAAQQQTKKTFECWTDDKGQRMCGDSVPPEYASKKREVRNEKGVVVDTKKAALTPEEQAEEARKAKEAAEAKKREEYDRSLLETYRSVKDIETMRKERLDLIDARITATSKIKEENSASLKNLQDRAEAAQKDNKPVDARLAKQIKQYQKLVTESQGSLDRMSKERQQTDQTFSRDITRYNELKGIPATPAPAPAAAKPADTASPPPKK